VDIRRAGDGYWLEGRPVLPRAYRAAAPGGKGSGTNSRTGRRVMPLAERR
jgi:hypothetical protein